MEKHFTGEYVICQCITQNGIRICKPKGKAFKFPKYIWVKENASETTETL